MQTALQTARAQYSAGSTELRTATVVRRGVDYDPQHNPAKRGDRKHFKLENVFWLRTITGKWVACLRPRGGIKCKPLSLAMFRVLWRGVTGEDIGRNEIIGDGNVVHPFVPPLYLDRLRTKRDTRNRRMSRCFICSSTRPSFRKWLRPFRLRRGSSPNWGSVAPRISSPGRV